MRHRLQDHQPAPPSPRRRGPALQIAEVVDAYERDREFIALELHDNALQTLASALHHLQAAYGQTAEVSTVQENLRKAILLLRQAMDEARGLARQLRPPVLDSLGLVETLRRDLEHLQEETGCQVRLEAQLPLLPQEMELPLYRIVREAILNARKHSLSPSLLVRVSIQGHPPEIRAIVRDWGRGFDPSQAPRDRIGLLSMRARALAAGGKCLIRSAPGHGTTVRVRLPLLRPEVNSWVP